MNIPTLPAPTNEAIVYDGLSLDPRYCLDEQGWSNIEKALDHGTKSNIIVNVVKPLEKDIPKEIILKKRWYERMSWTPILLVGTLGLITGGLTGFAIGVAVAK